MNHPRKTRTHRITNYAARFTYILYVHPSLVTFPPTAHPPRKALSKRKEKNLYPSPRSLNRTKTKVLASHGRRKKRIWMPSRLSLRIWKLRCEERELHLWNVVLGWRKIVWSNILLTKYCKVWICDFFSFFSLLFFKLKVLQTHSLLSHSSRYVWNLRSTRVNHLVIFSYTYILL